LLIYILCTVAEAAPATYEKGAKPAKPAYEQHLMLMNNLCEPSANA
jgi:hypothetical protein